VLEAEILAFGGDGKVRLAPWRRMVSVAVFAGGLDALQRALGGALPGAGKTGLVGGVMYLWSGPGSWLAVAEDDALEERVAAAARGLAAVTDQSDGKIVFLVDGGLALQKLVPLDLEAMGEDDTALTLAGHIPVQIWRESGGYALACFRSYGASLHHALVEALGA
jgi:sarcosine oxidase subunit gamma